MFHVLPVLHQGRGLLSRNGSLQQVLPLSRACVSPSVIFMKSALTLQ